jgi:hypothetical protein
LPAGSSALGLTSGQQSPRSISTPFHTFFKNVTLRSPASDEKNCASPIQL